MGYKTETHWHRQQYGGYQREEGQGKGIDSGTAINMVMEDDLTVGVGMQCSIQISYCSDVHLKPT